MNPSSPLHPPEEIIERYVRGKLSNGELDSFEEHLLTCVPCQSCTEELDTFVRSLKQAVKELEHPSPPLRDWFRSMSISGSRVAWTAAFVAVAALIVFVPGRNTGSQAISLAVTRGAESAVHAK